MKIAARLMHWLLAVVRWLFSPRKFWLAFTVPIIYFAAAAVFPANVNWEARVRWMGLLLQVSGIITVIKGLSELRVQFDRPSLPSSMHEWLRNRPRWNEKKIGLIIAPSPAVAGTGACSARVFASVLQTATLEDRVATLEWNQKSHYNEIGDIQNQLAQESHSRRRDSGSERSERITEDEKIKQRHESSAVGGLSLQYVSIFWLLLGTVLGTGSAEIAKWFAP
jgi:hypothetical protein